MAIGARSIGGFFFSPPLLPGIDFGKMPPLTQNLRRFFLLFSTNSCKKGKLLSSLQLNETD